MAAVLRRHGFAIAFWIFILQFVEPAIINDAEGIDNLLLGQFSSSVKLTATAMPYRTIDFNLSGLLPNVETLIFTDNPHLESFTPVALMGLNSLKTLHIINSGLKSLPNLYPVRSTLEELRIEECPMTSINETGFNDMEKLSLLDIKGCPITNFPDLSGISTLHTVVLDNADIGHIDSRHLPESAITFNMSYNVGPVDTVQLTKHMPNLTALTLDSNQLTVHINDVLKGCHKLDTLNIEENNLTEFPDFDTCSGTVKTLRMNHNKVVIRPSDDLSNVTKLRTLNIKYNHLTSFSFGPNGLPNLGFLNIYDHSISSNSTNLTLSLPYPKLEKLWARSGPLDVFPDISKALLLTHLHLSKNKIKTINASSFNESSPLEYLDMDENELDTFPPIASLKSLTYLSLDKNNLLRIRFSDANPTGLPVKSLPLETLDLSYNNLANESDTSLWETLTNLTYLKMTNCHLSTLPVYLITLRNSLTDLFLQGNNLEELSVDVLSKLTLLKKLCLQHNNLQAVPAKIFKEMKHLEILYLYSNRLKTLGNIVNLARSHLTVNLGYNNFDCNVSMCWMKTNCIASALNLKFSSKPCATPEGLKDVSWELITKAALGCKGECTVAELGLPQSVDVFARVSREEQSIFYKRSSLQEHSSKFATKTLAKDFGSCSLECPLSGNDCVGFIFDFNNTICWKLEV